MLKNKRFKRAVIILLIISLIVGIITIRPRPADADTDPSLTDKTVGLKVNQAGTVTVEFVAPKTGVYVGFEGNWSLNETTSSGEETETNYFTLVGHDIADSVQFVDGTEVDEYYYYGSYSERLGWANWSAKNTDSNEQGLDITAGETIWTATYNIAANTPVGEYYIAFSGLNADIYDADNNYDFYDDYDVIVAKITIERVKTEIVPKVTFSENTYTYTGSQITPEVTVTDSEETITLTKGTDYTISYGENINAGTEGGSVTISPVETSDYTFTETTVKFDIQKAVSNFSESDLATYGALLRQRSGIKLSDIALPYALTLFFSWNNPDQVIVPGYAGYIAGLYSSTYQNPDTTNYLPNTNLQVPVYGLTQVDIDASVDGGNGTIQAQVKNATTGEWEDIDSLEAVWEDTEVQFVLIPDADYKVNRLLVNGSPVTVTDNKATVTVLSTDMTVVASFMERREDLVISGQDDNQSISYTGLPVVLVGSLSVSENEDEITVSDLETTWYNEAGEEIEQPVTVGAYKVEYSYYGDNYKGSLIINFNIIKADSVLPPNAIEMLTARLKIPKDTPLAAVDPTGYGAEWDDPTMTVQQGSGHTYPAHYWTNYDKENYNSLAVDVPVYGLNYVKITTSVDENYNHGTISDSKTNALEGVSFSFDLTPETGYKLRKVLVDGVDKTADVSENKITITALSTDMTVVASFRLIQEDLLISGIEDNQEIAYTGQPVQLVGSLAVGENEDDLTVDDVEETWYNSDDEEIERPTTVGEYKVVFSLDSENYKGNLTVNVSIVKADSVIPEGVIEQIAARLKLPVGTALSDINITPYGATWIDSTEVVTAGANTYPALYVTNGDTDNYNPTQVDIPIYGLSIINIKTSVDGENGTISESQENVLEGTDVTITLTPEDGYQVKEVAVDGETVTVSSNTVKVTAGTKDIEVVAKFERIPFEYEYLEGKGQTVDLNSQETATFRINADYSLLDKIYVDNIEVTNAETKSGSTVVTLTKEFLDTLTAGTHTLKVTFKDNGVAATTFTVKVAETTKEDSDTEESTSTSEETTEAQTSSTPKTGDKVLMDIYIAIVSGLGIFMIVDHKLNSKPRKSTRRRK